MSQESKSPSEESPPVHHFMALPLSVVKNSLEKKGVLYFTLENTNVSIANALRRTILSDIPTVVFNTTVEKGDLVIIKNTTRFNNEILKQRLGCIPIHIKNHDDISDLIVELNETNKKDALEYITTKNLKIKNSTTGTYLVESVIRKIFPANKQTESFILFTRLRPKISKDIPGESIHLEAKLSLGTAKEDGMYNVVSTCAYGNTPDQSLQNVTWESNKAKLTTKGMSGAEIDYKRKNWYALEGKRHFHHNSFDFKIETVGVYSNQEIINKACDIIIQKLEKIKSKCVDNTLVLNKQKTAMKNSADIKLAGEGYTIGKIIEYILHTDYYLAEDRTLSYLGFIKHHPHDDYSTIRMAFIEDDQFNDQNIYKMISYGCQSGIKIFQSLKEYFLG